MRDKVGWKMEKYLPRLILYLAFNNPVTIKDVADYLRVDYRTARNFLDKLCDMGILEYTYIYPIREKKRIIKKKMVLPFLMREREIRSNDNMPPRVKVYKRTSWFRLLGLSPVVKRYVLSILTKLFVGVIGIVYLLRFYQDLVLMVLFVFLLITVLVDLLSDVSF